MNRGTRLLTALAGLALVPGLMVMTPATAANPTGPSFACPQQPADADTGQTRIMLAGDSITNASVGDYTWRYWLDQDLSAANVDLVGRFDNTLDANTGARTTRQFRDCDFDRHHESVPGAKLFTNKVAPSGFSFTTEAPANLDATVPAYPGYDSWIEGAVATHTPDILVVFAGSNDLALIGNEFPNESLSATQIASRVIGFLKDLIAKARAARPGLDIVLTTVPPVGGVLQARFDSYNAKLVSEVVNPDTAPGGSRLVLAQLPSWANNTWDGLHPDAIGEAQIAATITNALHEIDSSLPVAPNPVQTPTIGPYVAATLQAPASSTNGEVALSWTLPPGSDRTLIYEKNLTTPNSAWTLKADLVKQSLRTTVSNDIGTAVCETRIPNTQNSDSRRLPCTTYTVSGLSDGFTYGYKLRSAKGLSVAPTLMSNEVQVIGTGAVALGKLATPSANAIVHGVELSWPAMAGATGYDVRWRAIGSAVFGTTTATGASRTISGLLAGRRYGFAVRATNSGSAGEWSEERTGIPGAQAIAAGKKPNLRQLRKRKIKVVWAPSAGANRYQVQMRAGKARWRVIATTNKRALVRGRLVKGKVYRFRVRPFDSFVGGPASPVAKRKVR